MENILASLDSILGTIVAWLASIILFDFGMGVPLVVAALLIGGIYYSFTSVGILFEHFDMQSTS